MSNNYLFKSERLGFRNWSMGDLSELAAMNADPEVMAHFPKTATKEESRAIIDRFKHSYAKRGYTYYAVEVLETGEFIGFIGFLYQDYPSPYTPATDIGWRLKKSAWGKGYATEGARRCLDYAFEDLKMKRIISVCTSKNVNSENVMKKIGMTIVGEFDHPKMKDYPDLERCVCYEIDS